jgi:hypothetical protein
LLQSHVFWSLSESGGTWIKFITRRNNPRGMC